MNTPSISVVVLCRNHARYVAECLRSVFAADQPVELVFADNASKDDSLAIARATLAEAPPHVTTKIVELKPEEPLCRFFNIAVRASSGEIVKPIAADDLLGPNFFLAYRHLVATSAPAVGAWLAGSVMIDDNGQILRAHYPTLFGAPDDGPPMVLVERDLIERWGAPRYTAASLFYRRQVYTDVGGYDERFRFEDRPFLFDVVKSGWTVLVHPYNNTYYRLHNTQMSAVTNSDWMAEARLPMVWDHALRAEWRNKPLALWSLAKHVRVVGMSRFRAWKTK